MKKNNLLIFLVMTTILCMLVACGNVLVEENTALFNGSDFVDEETTDNLLTGDYPVSLLIPQPNGVSASEGEHSDQIVVNWNQVIFDGRPIKYHVYRRLLGAEVFIRVTGFNPVSALSFNDTIENGIESGVSYQYAVKALSIQDALAGKYSRIVTGYTLGMSDYLSVGFRESTENIEINWSEVPGANYYVLRRALEKVEGYIPAETEFKIVGSALTSTSYEDFASTYGGELSGHDVYYYFITAHYSSEVIGQRSVIMKGALLPLGAPESPIVTTVSRGLMKNAIRVEWEFSADVTGYSIYRITEDQLKAGNTIGTKINIDADYYGNFSSTAGQRGWYYDLSDAIESGDKFYYRLAGENAFGSGKLSALSNADEKRKASGWAIDNYSNTPVYVGVTQTGFLIDWPVCKGAVGYYLYRADADPAAYTDDQWEYVDYVSYSESDEVGSTQYVDVAANLPSGVNLIGSTMWYRVLPVDSAVVESDALHTLKSGFAIPDSERTIQDLIDNEIPVDFVPVWGISDYSSYASDFTVAVPSITAFNISSGSESFLDTINVSGTLSDASGLDKLNVILERVCYYGDESEIYPLAQPEKGTSSPRIRYVKDGQSLVANTVVYNLKTNIASDGTFSWNDPMPDFNDQGEVKSTGMKWDYKHWDREAWKHILRKKYPDTTRMVDVYYRLRVERASDAAWDVQQSAQKKGHPALSNKYAGHLAMWMKDTAFNRLWHIMVPRYCWDNTVAWLKSQSGNGQISGNAYLNVSFTSGSGGISGDYSDWPGHIIHMGGINQSVSLESDVARNVSFTGDIDTPYYDIPFEVSVWVRDYGMHWGIYNGYEESGYIKVNYNGRGWVDLAPKDVMIVRYHSFIDAPDGDDSNNNIHGYELRDNKFANITDFTNSCYFTRINFKYRPIPINSDWKNSPEGASWQMSYDLSNW